MDNILVNQVSNQGKDNQKHQSKRKNKCNIMLCDKIYLISFKRLKMYNLMHS
jgi:hypothetical protein